MKPIIRSTTLALAVGSACGAPLLTDNFSDANFDASSFNNHLATTQGGSLAPITYTVAAPGGGYTVQHGNGGNMLVVGNSGIVGGTASLNHDFAIEANLANKPLTVSFNVNDVSDEWGQFGIGNVQGDGVLANDFAILFQADGGWQAFKSGTALGSGAAGTWSDGALMTFVFSDTDGTGSAFNGNGSKVSVTLGGTNIGTFALDQLSTGSGYLTWGGYQYYSWSVMAVDNLSIGMDATFPAGETLTWTGATDSIWDEITANWSNLNAFTSWYSNSGNPNSVVFDATGAAQPDVTFALTRPLAASSITFDTTGYNLGGNVTISRSLNVIANADATVSANIAGPYGLEKTGAAKLVLIGNKAYTGPTTISGGTLELSGATAGNAQIHGPVVINPGATLSFTNGDGTGFGFFNNPSTSFTVNGGTINAISGSHLGFGAIMNMTLNNGGTLQGSWHWNGDGQLSFSSVGDNTNTISGTLILRADNGANHSFYVADGASSTDLQINAALSDQWPEFSWLSPSNLIKNGPGKMVLAGANSYDGNTVINDGTLEVTTTGGLRFRPTTNGTTNSVSGSATATLTFAGAVDLDLTAAVAVNGNSWNLFNLASFSGPSPVLAPTAVTSTLGSFAKVSSGVWEFPVTGAKWVFTEADGTLAYSVSASDYDTWSASFGLTGGATGDDDSDGMTNQAEYAFGLIPNSGSSVNPIVASLNPLDGTFSYNRRAQSLTGLTYTIWYSTNLTSWTQDNGAIQGTPVPSGQMETVPVTLSSALLSNPKLFIRVRAN